MVVIVLLIGSSLAGLAGTFIALPVTVQVRSLRSS
jgi:predicted PurR-regulated permease PerM